MKNLFFIFVVHSTLSLNALAEVPHHRIATDSNRTFGCFAVDAKGDAVGAPVDPKSCHVKYDYAQKPNGQVGCFSHDAFNTPFGSERNACFCSGACPPRLLPHPY